MIENNGLSDFYKLTQTIVSVTDMGDEELIFHVLSKGLTQNAFFSGFDLVKIRERNYPATSYQLPTLIAEMIRRHKNRGGARATLTGRIAKSESAALTPGALLIQEKGVIAELPVKRGTIFVDNEVNAHDRLLHAYTALVQVYRPSPIKQGKGFVPEITDANMRLYPSPTMQLPAIIKSAYAFSATAEEVPLRCVDLGKKNAADPIAYSQLIMLPGTVINNARGGMNIKGLTTITAPSTPEEAKRYTIAGIPTGFSPGYAPLPKAKLLESVTLESAYEYLSMSREVRGSDNKGIAFNTAGYYYGDLPTSYLRPISVAHNILYAYQMLLKYYPGLDAIYYNTDVSAFSTALELVALNSKVSSATTKNQSVCEIGVKSPNVGWEPMIKGKTYFFPLYLDRSVSKSNKLGWQWTPDHKDAKNFAFTQMTMYDSLARQYGVTFIYAVLIKADREILRDRKWVPSLHPHNGTVWWVPRAKFVCDSKSAQKFASRLAMANAWKNYYPFHRVPFVRFDLDGSDFKLIIKRPGIKVAKDLEVAIEFGPSEVELEAEQPFMADAFDAMFAKQKVMTEAIRDKTPESVLAPFAYEMSAVQDADPPPQLGVITAAQVFVRDSDDNL